MTSTKSYLIRALYEWIVDNNCTPHLLVNAALPGVSVPQAYVSDKRIVLNISGMATQGLLLGNDRITFDGRFDGASRAINVPIVAVLAIYARENGKGMAFEEEAPDGEPPVTPPEHPQPPSPPSGGRFLKVVK